MKYWNKAWSLVDGCTPCSPGCEHCWSAAIAHRFKREGEPGYSTGILTDEKGIFNGQIVTRPERLDIPLKCKKPTVYAVWNDLFHEDVDFNFIRKAFEVMQECNRHKFLILTKRHQKIREFMLRNNLPLKNVWCGLTVCNQQEVDEKIPVFLQVPEKKFLSIEPMLGAINIRKYLWHGIHPGEQKWRTTPSPIDVVILGGETGPNARPMHSDWVRSVRDQCQGVSFFFKQWGEWQPEDSLDFYSAYEKTYTNGRGKRFLTGTKTQVHEIHNPSKVNSHIYFVRVGSKKAGRLLDGREHNELPWNFRKEEHDSQE